jgi:hypothetical protein
MTLNEFLITEAVSGGLTIVLLIVFITRAVKYDSFGYWDLLTMLVMIAAMFLALGVGLQADAPGLYNHTLTVPQEAKVEGLNYIGGSLWQESLVRVDTDKGSFLMESDALIPHTGDVYLVKRRRPWGDPRMFLCLSAAANQCWAEWTPGN